MAKRNKTILFLTAFLFIFTILNNFIFENSSTNEQSKEFQYVQLQRIPNVGEVPWPNG